MLLPYLERLQPLFFQDAGSGFLRNVATIFPNYNAVPELDPDLYMQGSKIANDAELHKKKVR